MLRSMGSLKILIQGHAIKNAHASLSEKASIMAAIFDRARTGVSGTANIKMGGANVRLNVLKEWANRNLAISWEQDVDNFCKTFVIAAMDSADVPIGVF